MRRSTPAVRGTLVPAHPIPCHQQERGIGNEVEQIVEPAMRIIASPTVQLGLDLQYPLLAPRISASSSSSVFTGDIIPPDLPVLALHVLLAPFALRPAFPVPDGGYVTARDYYEASAPPARPSTRNGPARRHRTGCPAETTVDRRVVPTFTMSSIGQGGAQLYSGSIATATPQTFTVASPPLELNGFGVDPSTSVRSCTADRPISTRLEPASRLRSFQHWFAHAAPSDLAQRARTVWQYQHVPPSSGPLATHHRRSPRSGCPQLHQAAATAQRRRSLTTSRYTTAPRGAQLGPEENRRCLQDLVGPPQLGDLLTQRLVLLGHLRTSPPDARRCRPPSGVSRSATSPASPIPNMPGHRGDRRPLRGVLRAHLGDHAHRTLTKLVGILADTSHNSDPPKIGSLRKRRDGSVHLSCITKSRAESRCERLQQFLLKFVCLVFFHSRSLVGGCAQGSSGLACFAARSVEVGLSLRGLCSFILCVVEPPSPQDVGLVVVVCVLQGYVDHFHDALQVLRSGE